MFKSKKLKIAFNIMLLIVGIFALSQFGLATPFVLGGVILQGILGGFSGKVGPVVGGKWKDIDYMRGYVIPANPNTAGQQTVRTKFGALVKIAQALLPSTIQPYWDPFNSKMSGFNRFISENYALLDEFNELTDYNIGSIGSLQPATVNGAEYTLATGSITVTWPTEVWGNGLATDKIQISVYSKNSHSVIGSSSDAVRSAGTKTFVMQSGLTAGDMRITLFPYRGTGVDFMVASATFYEVTEP